MIRAFVLTAFAFGLTSQMVQAQCRRIDVVNGVYSVEQEIRVAGGATLLACDCQPGDDLVSGGCFISSSTSLSTAYLRSNGAGRQDGAWRWYCEPQHNNPPNQGGGYSVITVRVLCKAP